MDTLKEFLQSGKRILQDTQQPRKTDAKKKVTKKELQALESGDMDPHKRFVKMCVKEKPKKKEILEQFQRWIDQAEAEL